MKASLLEWAFRVFCLGLLSMTGMYRGIIIEIVLAFFLVSLVLVILHIIQAIYNKKRKKNYLEK